MSEKKKTKLPAFLNADWFRVVLIVVAGVLTTLVLAFSVLTITQVSASNIEGASRYLVWVFICLGLTRFVSYLRSRSNISFIRAIILLLFDVALGVLVIFAKYDLYIFSISAGLYSLSIIVSRILKLIERHRVRDIVFNALIIIFAVFMAIGLFQRVEDDVITAIVLIECLFIAATAFVEVAVLAFAQLKLKVLFKIIIRTYALEVLFGLLTLMVSFSLVLMLYEPSMAQFPDALWYTFAVVTTIGFGDFTATTLVGRVLTVILGMYGIVVVAVITSIIVNFYNETAGKDDIKELKGIDKEKNKK